MAGQSWSLPAGSPPSSVKMDTSAESSSRGTRGHRVGVHGVRDPSPRPLQAWRPGQAFWVEHVLWGFRDQRAGRTEGCWEAVPPLPRSPARLPQRLPVCPLVTLPLWPDLRRTSLLTSAASRTPAFVSLCRSPFPSQGALLAVHFILVLSPEGAGWRQPRCRSLMAAVPLLPCRRTWAFVGQGGPTRACRHRACQGVK